MVVEMRFGETKPCARPSSPICSHVLVWWLLSCKNKSAKRSFQGSSKAGFWLSREICRCNRKRTRTVYYQCFLVFLWFASRVLACPCISGVRCLIFLTFVGEMTSELFTYSAQSLAQQWIHAHGLWFQVQVDSDPVLESYHGMPWEHRQPVDLSMKARDRSMSHKHMIFEAVFSEKASESSCWHDKAKVAPMTGTAKRDRARTRQATNPQGKLAHSHVRNNRRASLHQCR